MNNYKIKVITTMCGSLLISGCAFFRPSPLQFAIAPFTSVKNGTSTMDTEAGRGKQERKYSQNSIESYRKILERDPTNIEAHNALGMIYATQGQVEQAVVEFKAAAALAPEAAYIQNNLGFAYLLSGRPSDAMVALKAASELDPANERIRENLRRAQAATPALYPDSKRTSQAVGEIAELTPPQIERNVDSSAPTLVSVAPNIYELRQNVSRVASSTPAFNTQPTVKIEIVNGNGVPGLAKRTSSFLKQRGYAIARLTNKAPYKQTVTEIQYRPGQAIAAQRLTTLISIGAVPVESKELSSTIGVRVVLGRDMNERTLSTENANSPALAGGEPNLVAGKS